MTARQSSAVDKALRQISKGKTPYRAAKDCGVALSTIYRAIKRRRKLTAAEGTVLWSRDIHEI